MTGAQGYAEALRAVLPEIVLDPSRYDTPRNGVTRWTARMSLEPPGVVLVADRIVDTALNPGEPLRGVGAAVWKHVCSRPSGEVIFNEKLLRALVREMKLALDRAFAEDEAA